MLTKTTLRQYFDLIMLKSQARVTSEGMHKTLKRFKYDFKKSVCEYIWNGFDAGATNIYIEYKEDEGGLGVIESISVKDNGCGISHEDLSQKFERLLDSEKPLVEDTLKNSLHGKNGIGRLTFAVFAGSAQWDTVYKSKDGINKKYSITIESDNLIDFSGQKDVPSKTNEKSGTEVKFTQLLKVDMDSIYKLKDYLKKEFAWFLELNKTKNFQIQINNERLEYSDLLSLESDEEESQIQINGFKFFIKIIVWKEKLNDEYSRYYCLDNLGNHIFNDTTSLNLKGDKFYHSAYIKSTFFDDENFKPILSDNDSEDLIYKNQRCDEFKELRLEVEKLLIEKRKPFLRAISDSVVSELSSSFPLYDQNDPLDIYKKTLLEGSIKLIFEAEPRIFNLNKEQEKIFVRLLSLTLDSSERDNLFKLLDSILTLDRNKKSELVELLKNQNFDAIISTMQLVTDRINVINTIAELVYSEQYDNLESDIQKLVENHYWIFGEKYNLIAAEDDKFEKALTKFHHLLTGESKKLVIHHNDKNKEMDILLCRKHVLSDRVENLVLELKRPDLKVGLKEYQQVVKYMDVIIQQPECNNPNSNWDFYLIANGFRESEVTIMNTMLSSASNHGEKDLLLKGGNYKIYFKTWNQIIEDAKIRHNFLLERLNSKKFELAQSFNSKDEIHEFLKNSAVMQTEGVLLEPNGTFQNLV